MKNLIRNMITYHVNHNVEGCEWIASFLITSLSYNRIRWYPEADGYTGDAHWSSFNNNPASNDIHIYAGTFYDYEDLSKTLIHEAGHIYYQTSDGGLSLWEGKPVLQAMKPTLSRFKACLQNTNAPNSEDSYK